MNRNILRLFLFLLLVSTFCCSKENHEPKAEWIVIDSIMPGAEIADKLNEIFYEGWHKNECLLIDMDSILYPVFNMDEFANTDTCSDIPEIDFENLTLTIGGFTSPDDPNNISGIKLTVNEAKEIYSYEISMDTCEYCYHVFGYNYFWRIYPKLNPGYQFQLIIKNVE